MELNDPNSENWEAAKLRLALCEAEFHAFEAHTVDGITFAICTHCQGRTSGVGAKMYRKGLERGFDMGQAATRPPWSWR